MAKDGHLFPRSRYSLRWFPLFPASLRGYVPPFRQISSPRIQELGLPQEVLFAFLSPFSLVCSVLILHVIGHFGLVGDAHGDDLALLYFIGDMPAIEGQQLSGAFCIDAGAARCA